MSDNDETLLDDLGDDLEYDIEDEDALLADDYELPSSTQVHPENSAADSSGNPEEFQEYGEQLDDVLDLGVPDDLDSEIQDTTDFSSKTLVTIQNVNVTDADEEAEDVSESQEYVQITDEVQAESEEDEEKDSEERDRFKSERTNIISLKSAKMYGNIPDSLDKVITTDDGIKHIKTQNWKNKQNRGGLQGRGNLRRGGLGGRGGRSFHNNNQFRVFNNIQPFQQPQQSMQQVFQVGQNIMNAPPVQLQQHMQLPSNHLLSHPPPFLHTPNQRSPAHKILINPHFRGQPQHMTHEQFVWNSNPPGTQAQPAINNTHAPLMNQNILSPQGYMEHVAPPPLLDRPPPPMQQFYQHEPYREPQRLMSPWQEPPHLQEQQQYPQSVFVNNTQQEQYSQHQNTQIVLPPTNFPPPFLNQVVSPQQPQVWNNQGSFQTLPISTDSNQNLRQSGFQATRFRNSEQSPNFQQQKFRPAVPRFPSNVNRQNNNNTIQRKQNPSLKNRLGPPNTSPNNQGGFRNVQKRPSAESPQSIKHPRFESQAKRNKRTISNLHEVQTVDTLPDTTSESSLQQPEPEPEDEETREYRKKIEEQKKLREKILAQKEQRRMLAAMKKSRTLSQEEGTIDYMAGGDATFAQKTDVHTIATIVNKNPVTSPIDKPMRGVVRCVETVTPTQVIPNKSINFQGRGRARGRGRGRNMVLQRTALIEKQQVLQAQQRRLKVIQTEQQSIIADNSNLQVLPQTTNRVILSQPQRNIVTTTNKPNTLRTVQQQPRRVVIASTPGGQKIIKTFNVETNKPVQNSNRIVQVGQGRTVVIKSPATTTNQRIVQQPGTSPQTAALRRVKVDSTTFVTVGKTNPAGNEDVTVQSLPRTNIVSVDNLTASTSEASLKRMCRDIGQVEKIQMFKQQRKAILTFKTPNAAVMFFKRYHRKMIDLSLINVTLVEK